MIIVDANVVSEIAKKRPDRAATDWLRRFEPLLRFPTTIIGELYAGVALTKDAAAKALRRRVYDGYFDALADQIIGFDRACALTYADIVADCRAAGKMVHVVDAQVAAVAKALRAPVATRNRSDFECAGVETSIRGKNER